MMTSPPTESESAAQAATVDTPKSRKRVLEPIDRISEVLFGLIMVLTFTGSLSIADAGRDDVRAMLVGALGCNLAWGIIDGILYLMGCLAEKSRNLLAFLAIRKADRADGQREILASALPPVIVSVLKPSEIEAVCGRLKELPQPPARARLQKEDWLGGLAVFLLVFLCTFPVVIPFIFMGSVQGAMRVSNAIAVTMLFFTGYQYGRLTSRRPWAVGISMVLLGGVLVALTMALGG